MAGPLVDTLYRLRTTYDSSGMQAASRDYSQFNGQVARAGEAASLLSNRFRTAALIFSGGIGGAGKVFADVESAQITLARVTGLSGASFNRLLADVRRLAPELGRTEEETLNLAIAGARLGIEGASLVQFMRTSAQAATALGADLEQTSTQLAKLRANFVLSVGDLNKLTGAVIALDEASAAAFPEILRAMTTVGPLARIVGISAQQLAALSATIIETGISAETTGTALAQIFQSIQRRSEILGPLLGTTGEGLRRAFASDQIGTIQKVAQAYVHLLETGADTSQFLTAIGLDGRRATAVLSILGSQTGRTAELMGISNGEFAKGALLAQAFGKAAEALAFQWNVLKTEFLAMARTVGERLAPLLDGLMKILVAVFQAVKNSPFLQFTIALGLVAGAIGSVVAFMGFFIASQLIAFRTARVGMPFLIAEYHALAAAIHRVVFAQAAMGATGGAGAVGFLGKASLGGRTAALGALGQGAGTLGIMRAFAGGAGGSFIGPLVSGLRVVVALASRLAIPITIAVGVFTALKDNMFGARDALVDMFRPFQKLFGGEGKKSLGNVLSILQSITKVIGGIFGIAIRIAAEILTPIIKLLVWVIDKILWVVNTVVLGPIKWLLDKLGLGDDGPSFDVKEGRPSAGGNVFYPSGPVTPGVRTVSTVPGSAQINNTQNNVIFPNMQVRSQQDVEQIREVVRQEQRRMASEAS